jgi:hypothetical protein
VGLFDELHKLEQLHQHGSISREELEHAKLQLLDSAPPDDNDCATLTLEEALAQDQAQDLAELAQIDAEWEQERRQHQITTQRGQTFIPSKSGAWLQMVACVAFGVCWTIVGLMYPSGANFGDAFFPGLGIAIIAFSVIQGLYFLARAKRYQLAEAAYQQRRRAAMKRSAEI